MALLTVNWLNSTAVKGHSERTLHESSKLSTFNGTWLRNSEKHEGMPSHVLIMYIYATQNTFMALQTCHLIWNKLLDLEANKLQSQRT